MKNIKKSYFIIFVLIVLTVVCLSTSYAIFLNTREEHGKLNIVVGNLNYKVESNELDGSSITIPANTSKEIKLTSLNETSSKYELYYTLDGTNDKVSVGYSRDTEDNVLGMIEANKSKMITIAIRNDSDTIAKVTFKVLGGLLGNDLVLKDGNSLNQEIALCSYEKGYVWNFDYTGGEQEFTIPCSGEYKLETWGAQGGSYDTVYYGGYGGYSLGNTQMKNNQTLYINIGGKGVELVGGYNGGCTVNDFNYGKAGGGATHIATISGLLSELEEKLDNILILSGAGGGAAQRGSGYGDGNGGSAGGYIGSNGVSINHTNGFGYGYGTGATQTSGGQIIWTAGTYNVSSEIIKKSFGTFGRGGGDLSAAGGGSGLYGGGGSSHGGAGGGSSYIGNPLLYNKTMFCYNCEESSEESTKTISTTCTSETPTENCSKQGNGYARITYLGN